MEDEIKEWVSVTHSPGKTFVRVSLQQGNLSAKWSEPTYGVRDAIKNGVIQARAKAHEALEELREAVSG